MRLLISLSIILTSMISAMHKDTMSPEKEKAVQAVCNYYLRSHAHKEGNYQPQRSERWRSLFYDSLRNAPFSQMPTGNLCNLDCEDKRYLVETTHGQVLQVYSLVSGEKSSKR